MKRFVQITLSVMPLLVALPANAQATRTWVSGVGDDVNPCSRTAPCKTFAGTISKTAAGGEINALDPGGFGAVVITKALTISQEGTGTAGILVVGTNGITVNAGANDMVVLKGLDIDGGPVSSGGGLNGVRFIAGGGLVIQDSVIRNFTNAAAGWGIAFQPSGASTLSVIDTVISTNGQGTIGGGVLVQPTGTGSAKASFTRVSAINNVLGIRADGTGSTGGISVSVSNSTASGNTFSGMTAFTPVGGASVKMNVTNSVSTNNGTGLNANGSAATLRVGGSAITLNAAGVTVSNSAVMTSLGNNMIVDNVIAGPVLPIVGPQ